MNGKDHAAIGYQFESFVIDLMNRQLRQDDQIVPLNSKYFDVLVLLIRRAGQLTTKQFIFDQVWRDVVVTDSALSQCIKDIRKALGDQAAHPHYIKTVSKHGFVFTAPVQEVTDSLAAPSLPGEYAIRPYKFLDYYTEQDAALFFGRETDIETICSKILGHRTFILHGRSGVGKSSIIRAGLLPVLKRQGNTVYVIRSFANPYEQMIDSLLSFARFPEPPSTKVSLSRLIKQIMTDRPNQSIIFFLDQFEDFFTLLPEEIRKSFIEHIGNLFSDESLPLKLIFVLREDLLSEMSRFKTFIPEIYHNEYRLCRLNQEQASRVITEPAKMVGCPLEAGLSARILTDLNAREDADPPQLQIVCDALYDARNEASGMTLQLYKQMGGARKILEEYLERVMRRFSADELLPAKDILKSLISEKNQRLVLNPALLQQRICSGLSYGAFSMNRLIEELASARVIRIGRQDGQRWIELSHDFLIPQISLWINEEEAALKRAQALIERALENYIAHQLLLDQDAIELILSFGKQLFLTEQEADLLALSLLQRKFPLPDWLVHRAPSAQRCITEAARHDDCDIRICAVESCHSLRNEQIKHLLQQLALWDNDLLVRKAASIELVRMYRKNGQLMLAKAKGDKIPGVVRRAISLSFVRDQEKGLIHLSRLPLTIAALVTLGLMWVRILRNRHIMLRRVTGATWGASLAGVTVGLMLGAALAIARHAASFEATTTILVLMSLGAIAGAFGGFGVSAGIVIMQNISYRHSHWWSVAGGAMGGFGIGGLLNILGVDILRALFGQNLSGITGALEGAVIGFGLSLGITLAGQINNRYGWLKVLGAALGAMLGAIILTTIKGNLFSGSIEAIARSFADSQINLETLASLFGETHIKMIPRLVLGAVEGFLFGGFMAAGMDVFNLRIHNKSELNT